MILRETRLAIDVQSDANDAFAQMASLHASELHAGFLPLLGQNVLTRLYRYAARDTGSSVLVAVMDGQKVLGFALGVVNTRAFFVHFALRNAFLLSFAVLRRPGVIARALSGARYAAGSHSNKEDAELLSIAVNPASARSGIGSELIRALSLRLSALGSEAFRVAAADTQVAALAFYQKHGGKLIARTNIGGLPTNVFRVLARS